MPEPSITNVTVANQTFAFKLHTRKIDLGPCGIADYYWMDNRAFRADGGGPNFKSCLDHAWAAMEHQGALGDDNALEMLLLAEIYKYVRTSKKLTKTYMDALPSLSADRDPEIFGSGTNFVRRSTRTYMLDDDEEARLKSITDTRSVPFVKAEFDRLFLVAKRLPEDRDWLNREFSSHIHRARNALHQGERAGLQSHIKKDLLPWMKEQRRRGSNPRTRLFLNAFSYECKVAFNNTYANAWISLLNVLKAESKLDPLSERLMRLWHHQNQAFEQAEGENVAAHWLFGGQVLALHPLSVVALGEVQHRHVLGAWLGHPDYEVLQATKQVGNCPAYWDFVKMVMVAGHEYKHARQASEDRRGIKHQQFNDRLDHFDDND